MLRVKVQSCKWECLLCSRTFSTKFCYALHCKNVHGKCHEDSFIDSSCIIDDRPHERSTEIENLSNGSNVASPEGKYIALAGRPIATTEQNEKEKDKDGIENIISCEVCKKTFSSGERLNIHKTLHAVAYSSNRSTRSNAGKISKESRGRARNKRPKPREDDCRAEPIKDHEQRDEVEERSHLEGSQSRSLNDQKLINNDHFYATSVPESNGVQQSASIVSEVPVQLQNAADVKDDTENNSQFLEGTIVEAENAATPIAVAHTKKRGRPRKEQALAIIMPSAAETKTATADDTSNEQSIVFPYQKDEEKEARKSGPRKKTRECDICRKIFANRSSLREHRRIHTGEKPFICAVCDKGFIRMGHLKQHMCSHTGLWPFKCGACGKGFMNPSRVTRHMRVHNDERPNICDQCGESFKEPHHLARHMHLHSGVKPYKCPICEDRYFIQSGNLKIHMKIHEGGFTDSNVALDEISHEIVASTSQLRDENASSAAAQEVALEGIITVSEGDIEGINSVRNSSNLNREPVNEDADESANTQEIPTVNEIVLQIVPGAEHNVQVHGLQGLASIDQELLRQFATSVAHELAQSEQAT